MALILGLVFGIASGSAVITDLNEWGSFRLVLMLQSVLPVAALFGLLFSVTSPIYMIKKDQPAEAVRIMQRLTGIKDEQTLQAKVAALQYAVAMELEERKASGDVSVLDLFRNKVDRRRTLLAIGVFVATQAAG